MPAGQPAQVIHVDKGKCVNCHACIASCPVKMCNDGSGDHVSVDPNTCIGCGLCLTTCTHGARYFTDDIGALLSGLAERARTVAVVAPSAASNFNDDCLRLNGWLKRIGVEAVFDVSFGADLCAKSLFEHLCRQRPKLIISQPCPVVVSYIQIHQPSLLQYLAPVDSPAVHVIKMIRRYYPEYRGHRIAFISPCPAKRRELDQAAPECLNVTFASVREHLERAGTPLGAFPEVEFTSPLPGKGVFLPTPGGLIEALDSWFPNARRVSREVHGTHAVCTYLRALPETIRRCPGSLPLLVDCLSCEHGCNAGPASATQDEAVDELELRIHERYRDRQRSSPCGSHSRNNAVAAFWEDGLYARRYADYSDNVRLQLPNDEQRLAILQSMRKYGKEDLFNCCSCGYGSCDQMVVAIHNGLNRPENCHHYLAKERAEHQAQLTEYRDHLESLVEGRTAELRRLNERLRQEVQDRERAEKASSDSERKLWGVVHGSPIPQFVIDRNHKVIYWNKAIEQYSGIPNAQMLGTSDHWKAFYRKPRPCLADLLVDEQIGAIDAMYPGKWRRAALLDEAYEATAFFPKLGKAGRWLFFTAAAIRDASGTIVGALETLEDITARKESELQLATVHEAAQAASRAKSEFLANMSHEIRTPMTAILGYADLVLGNLKNREDVESVQTIKRNGEHLLSVINDILDLSKVEAGMMRMTPSRCSPKAIVEETLALMRVRSDAKGLSLSAEFAVPVPETISSDPTRLRQILINLMGNAIKFTEVGGVRVRMSLEGAATARPRLRIDVVDTGIGITDEQKASLFQPFWQGDSSVHRKTGGTGLGLAISRRLAQILGGDILVDGSPGKGTTFSLLIDPGPLDGVPMLTDPVETPKPPPRTASVLGSDRRLDLRILLAEDGIDNQRLISRVLGKAGAEVVVAENGEVALTHALAAFSESLPAHHGPAPFDVILMDMQMPVLDGYEATRRLRDRGYDGPIIALTAHAMTEDRQKCLDAGCSDYLTKPIDWPKLFDLITQYCSRPRHDDAQGLPTDLEGAAAPGGG